ncbi:alpha/beta hydrolase [candidate division KSB1 bacterium]
MKKLNFTLILVILLTAWLAAQEKGITRTDKIQSKILNEERSLYIYLPADYEGSHDKYPVLYTLYNGDKGFQHTIDVLNSLKVKLVIPDIIMVSVNVDGRRDLTPSYSREYGPTSGGADNFIRFCKEEMVPYIEKNFRTGSDRLYWSHSIAGTFGIYALLIEPDLFTTVLVSSPWFIYDLEERFLLKNTKKFLQKRSSQKNGLFIVAGTEPNLTPSIDEFIKILENQKPEGLRWKYWVMSSENHSSIVNKSLKELLTAYYSQKK